MLVGAGEWLWLPEGLPGLAWGEKAQLVLGTMSMLQLSGYSRLWLWATFSQLGWCHQLWHCRWLWMPATAVPKLPLDKKCLFQVTGTELRLVCHNRGNTVAFEQLVCNAQRWQRWQEL